MEQRASSLQQRLEARRNMFLAGKTGDGGGGSGPPPVPGTQPAYISSRTGKWKNVSTIQSRNSNFIVLRILQFSKTKNCKPLTNILCSIRISALNKEKDNTLVKLAKFKL